MEKNFSEHKKIEYAAPQLKEFSYDDLIVHANDSGCEMRYDYTSDCNNNKSGN